MLWDSRLKLPRPNASFSKTLIALLHACLLSAVCTSATVAQSPTTGRIAGTLKDPNGARIVGAQVTITSNATAEQRRVTSDDQGNYSAPLLSPGTYVVRIAPVVSRRLCLHRCQSSSRKRQPPTPRWSRPDVTQSPR